MSVDQVSYKLGCLTASIDALNENVSKNIAHQIEINDKMDRRLRKVEAKQHWYAGAGSALGAIFGIFIGRH